MPPEASYSISEIEWDKATAPPMRVRDILCNYLAGISLENLITLQSKEKWISNTSKQSTVYQIDGLCLRKHQLNNGIYVSQVLLPDNLAESLLRTFHVQPMVMHIGVEKMKRHLFQLFYIRNFQALATKITQSCQFCLINKPYPQAKLSPGTRIIVNQPGMIISLDLCTIRSNSNYDSFLTI